MDKAAVNELFAKFRETEVLVLGDVMVDYYISGQVTRLSPEAPVPIVDVRGRDCRLGGAANVALNLKSLGANPVLCSVVGDDAKADVISDLLTDNNMEASGLIRLPERKTTVKYRIIGNNTQIARVDDETDALLTESEQEKFVFVVEDLIESHHFNAIVFEDYDKGLFSENVIRPIVKTARRKNIFTAVDPKRRNFSHYAEVDFFKPNLHELADGLNMRIQDSLPVGEVRSLSEQFAKRNGIRNMMVTLSERGLAFYSLDGDRFFHYPALRRHVSDVSGAGDTVLAVATLCMVCGLRAEWAAQAANLAGGLVCGHVGVRPVDPDKLKTEMESGIIG